MDKNEALKEVKKFIANEIAIERIKNRGTTEINTLVGDVLTTVEIEIQKKINEQLNQ
jgi:hypothetical protein